ncbi:GmrSD restriction endonuclease domain-containing protein [Streptomyces smyrnaeus]|uniref:GmrSD restriction endonuclease domain-containing protein n=1 Tax=Streptomyces smyrnaeus TaxID=1387713 RepID=UPI00367D6B09
MDGGKWLSDYDGLMLTSPSKRDIDHVVPLKDAWFSGARTWTPDKRKQFHNDMARPQLLAVSSARNRSRGDKAPRGVNVAAPGHHCIFVHRPPLERPSAAFYRAPQPLPLLRTRSHPCSSVIRPLRARDCITG